MLRDPQNFHLPKQAHLILESQQRTADVIHKAWQEHALTDPEEPKVITLRNGYWVIDLGEEFQMAVKVIDFTRILNQRSMRFSDLLECDAGGERFKVGSPLSRGARQQKRRLNKRDDVLPSPADYNSNEEDELEDRRARLRSRKAASCVNEERAEPPEVMHVVDDGLRGIWGSKS